MLEKLQADPGIGPVTILLLADSGYARQPAGVDQEAQTAGGAAQCGASNREGRPDSETLEAVEGYDLLLTDRNGWIKLTTDDAQLWADVERE